jgi:hypothetical protein
VCACVRACVIKLNCVCVIKLRLFECAVFRFIIVPESCACLTMPHKSSLLVHYMFSFSLHNLTYLMACYTICLWFHNTFPTTAPRAV